jgi:hypothetical protein
MILIKGKKSKILLLLPQELFSQPVWAACASERTFPNCFFFYLPRSFSLNDLASCGFERTLSNMANMYAPAKSQKS